MLIFLLAFIVLKHIRTCTLLFIVFLYLDLWPGSKSIVIGGHRNRKWLSMKEKEKVKEFGGGGGGDVALSIISEDYGKSSKDKERNAT